MSRVKSKETKLEVNFRKLLSSKGLRYRKNPKNLYGKPDIAFNGKKLAIFIDGCFWHGCTKHCRAPLTNVAYWHMKIKKNQKRDKEVNKAYKKMGWTALRFWEHHVEKDPSKAIDRILSFL